MSILRHRLHRAVTLLRLWRLMVVAMAMAVPIVAGVIIVGVRVLVRYRERGLFKEMMNPMRRRGREKKNKEGDDPQGADGAKIVKDFFHDVEDYLYFLAQCILIKNP